MRIRDVRRQARPTRGRVGLAAVGAMVVGLMASVGVTPADATQAAGDDAAVWYPGWSWTYGNTSFRYYDASTPTDVTINENVTYTVADVETFQGQQAYKLNISGSITGGSGSTNTGSTGTASLDSFSGSVSGTRFVRVSDLALLQENQQQHLNAKAHVSIITQSITADINLQLTPSGGWRVRDFPLNSGDNWHSATNVEYHGGFSYDAGSIGGSGSSPFDGSLDYSGNATTSNATLSNPVANTATDYVHQQNADGSMKDDLWWSPAYKNDAKETLLIPLGSAQLTLNRSLTSASMPTPATTISETVTPSLSCAGGTSVVSGTLSSHAAGQPVSVTIDKLGAGTVTANGSTDATGNYSIPVTVPADNDGFGKNGSRANWGVVVKSGSAMNVATQVVTAQDCSTLAYTGTTSAPTGTSVNATAKLTDLAGASIPGRTVTFALSNGSTVNGTTDAAGNVSVTLPVSGNPRNATLSVSYAGAGDLAAASTSAAFTVAQDPTTTSVSASDSSVTIGDPVTFTATVGSTIGSGPSGQVQFYVDGNSFGAPVNLVNGSATSASYATTALGDLAITAKYLGDTTYATSTSPSVNVHVHKVLAPTATSQTITPSSIGYGQSVTLSSHVTATADSGTPTGTVSFVEGGTTIATASVDASGNASIDVTTLPVGTHSITAKYSGDDDYKSSSSTPSTVSVTKANSAVTLSTPDHSTVAGQSVPLTVQVGPGANSSGTPTGTVQLQVDGSNVGGSVTLTGGSAVLPTLTSLLAGNHTISVQYSGDGNFNGNGDSFTQHVSAADTTTVVMVNPTPSGQDQNVTISANVAAVAPGGGSPTGTVSFTSDGTSIGAGALQANNGGGSTATLDIDSLAPGTHTIVASYAGDDSYNASEGETTHKVLADAERVATTTTLTSSKNPSTYGELISYKAKVEASDGGSVGGQVQFSIDGANFGDPVPVDANGIAESDTLGSPEPGDHTVMAAYQPDPVHFGSGDTLVQTVADADVAVHITSSKPNANFGDSVQFSATVDSTAIGTGAPAGYVQFAVDGEPLGDAVTLNNGVATSPATTDITPGSHLVTASYAGDVHFNPGLDSLTQSVGKVGTSTALTITPASSTYGDTVSLKAQVTPDSNAYGVAGGTVSFVEGTTTLATATLSNNAATVQISGLTAGSHSIKAVYSGSNVFAGSTSAAKTEDVAKRATNLSADAALVKLLPLGLPLGQLKATVTSSLGPVAGAPVVFKVGANTVCTSTTDASGVATCNAASQILALTLNLGYTATYAGDANFIGSTQKAGILK